MVGMGFDVHRLAAGESMILGGINLDSPIGTVAHSDGDVLFHALADAIFGAIGDDDIGQYFPDTIDATKNMNSELIVRKALENMTAKGNKLINVDITIVLEEPKLKGNKALMKENIARICELPLDRVSVKATTNERMGFIGRSEGIVVYAICQVD
jgi:2-C-methyl-D-erythritol 2,4-cyclodiphosphate synthase